MEPCNFYNPTSGREFVPPRILSYCGGKRPIARLKGTPEDFIVEEVGPDGTRFSLEARNGSTGAVGVGSSSGGSETRLVRVEVTKRGLTTGHVESLIRKMFRDLGHEVRVTYAGNKDRTAVTRQEMVLEGAPLHVVVKACQGMNTELTGRGFYLSNPAPATRHKSLGDLMGNCFRVRLHVPGMSASEILAHMTEKVAFMADNNWLFPNAYGKQRRGRCQKNDELGYAFLQAGPEEAFRRTLTMGAPDESQFAKDVRAALAREWSRYEAAKASGASTDEQFMSFVDMHQILVYGPDPQRWGESHRDPVHVKVNMPIEFSLVNLAAKFRNFDDVASRLRREFSLWVGAIQGYWYNQALAAYLDGKIVLPEDEIPLIVNRPRALRFYNKYFPEAIPGKYDERREYINDGLNKLVNRLYFQPNSAGPTRSPFARVRDFQFRASDEEVYVENMLPPGSFETTFLSLLFDLDGGYNNGETTEVAESDE